MSLETVYQFFQAPPPRQLNQELAVCYVLSTLLQRDSFASEMIQLLERNYPAYRLSDTVLYGALKFLEAETLIEGYRENVAGRGRPRRMFQITPSAYSRAKDLAALWQKYVSNDEAKQAKKA
ncbi:MAG: PadR family transcriptional regulator [Stenomitos rutilans HA7619-LM2]|jgi:DNA-binding PadR family transcriptional regulator|nr:PadR family transcriptional regulator [Stenomitos rutilans HA7619-LM2]